MKTLKQIVAAMAFVFAFTISGESSAAENMSLSEYAKDKLAGADVWTDSHVHTALLYVRWDD